MPCNAATCSRCFLNAGMCVVCSYPDVVLATLLCIRANLCRRRCEIKVNDMVFVGYPMQMPAAAGAASSTHASPSTCSSQSQVVQPSPKREQSSTVSYNIVFAVKVLSFSGVSSGIRDLTYLTYSRDNRDDVLKDDMQRFFTKLMQKSFLAAYCNINPSV